MSAFRIDVADLLTHRGARRPVRVHAPLDGLEVGAVRVREPIDVEVVLERVPDGIVVRGEIHARWEGECSHCLRDLAADLDLVVSELFEAGPGVDGDTYPLDGHELDLEQLVRDAVLLELPLAPTCATLGLAEGAGPAPEAATADAAEPDADAPVDPRWAALSDLEL
jgi:uncharacterized protein